MPELVRLPSGTPWRAQPRRSTLFFIQGHVASDLRALQSGRACLRVAQRLVSRQGAAVSLAGPPEGWRRTMAGRAFSASVVNTFASSPLDRLNGHRDRDALDKLESSHSTTRLAVAFDDNLNLWVKGTPTSLSYAPIQETPTPSPDALKVRPLLGRWDDRYIYAIRSTTPPEPDAVARNLRSVSGRLSPEEAAIASHGRALLEFHRRHAFCGTCGSPTTDGSGGTKRSCVCGSSWFPRTDPVIIAVVVDPTTDKLLLGRQARWPAGRYSALAGFMEHGESLEECVAREIFEESRVIVRTDQCRYHSSQPWPFPYNLMIGMVAAGQGDIDVLAGGLAEPGKGELDDARWFSRDEVAAMVDACEEPDSADCPILRVPPQTAIAHWLCRAFAEDDPITHFETTAPARL